MLKTYNIGFCLTSIALIVEVAFWLLGYKESLFGLIFLMPLLWTLWIFSIFANSKRKVLPLLLLWALIDIAVFGCVNLLLSETYRSAGTDGREYVFAIVFSPVILPLLAIFIISPLIAGYASLTLNALVSMFFPCNSVSLFVDWLGFSIMSATSILLTFVFIRFFKIVRITYLEVRRKSQR